VARFVAVARKVAGAVIEDVLIVLVDDVSRQGLLSKRSRWPDRMPTIPRLFASTSSLPGVAVA
jgi:hypothetical protein